MAKCGGPSGASVGTPCGALESRQLPLAPVPNMGGPAGGAGRPHQRHGGARSPSASSSCITSYNVPLTNVVGKLGPALAMGNTVIVKPAPQDPLGVIRLVEVMQEAGFPPGVVNVVVGSDPGGGRSARGVAARRHGELHRVSTAIGMRIGEVAGRSLKRQLMELGGKGASLVFDERRPRPGRSRASASTFTFHAGQICTAPTRADRPARRVRPDRREARRHRQGRQGRRPDRARHDRRPGHQRAAPGPRRGLRQGRRR